MLTLGGDTMTGFSRPWYRYSLMFAVALFCLVGCATTGPRLTSQQIVSMSKAGVPADQILQRMKESGTVYRFSASELARLKEQGVPDAVIDYMQSTYLADVRREQALLDWHMAPSGSYWASWRGWPRGPAGWSP